MEQYRYSLDTPLRIMMEHPAAKPLLQQYIPEILDNPILQAVINDPISSILSYAPQVRSLYEMILKAMNKSVI